MIADGASATNHYDLIASAIRFLTEHAHNQPHLKEVADHLGISEFHLQRVFVEWAGVSPKEFLQALTVERAKAALSHSSSLVNTTYDLGLSSSSRLHDLFVSTEAMSPGEFKNAGLNVVIRWSVEETPFGWALFAETEKGLCRVSFVMNEQEAVEDLKRSWPLADIRHDPKTLQFTIEEILRRMTGGTPKETLGVLLRGTPFRLKIWRALMEVPRGTLASYQTIAQMVGQPGAVRAVASSIGANPLAFLIPCHRVIRQTGIFGQYHWGEDRKLAMIGRELLGQYDSR